MTQAKKTFQPVQSSDVCQIYELLHEHKLVSFPLTHEATNKVDSLVVSITSSYFGTDAYSTFEQKAMAYLYFIIKDHAFTDGNKRTACLTFVTVCKLNDLSPRYSDFSLDELAVYIERTEEADHQKVIRVLADLLFSK